MSQQDVQGSAADCTPVRSGLVPHCDEPGCDLGTVQYQCPFCNKHNTNYDYELFHASGVFPVE